MTIAQLIPLALNLSMGLLVFCLGLAGSFGNALSLLRRPGLLVRSLVSMHVVMGLAAAVMALAFDLPGPVKIALVALALSPVPPILPPKQAKAGGTSSYVIGLLLAASVLSVLVVPVGFVVIDAAFGLELAVPAGRIAPAVLITVIVPLLAGLLVGQVAPRLAQRVARPLSAFATILLVVAALPILIGAWDAIVGAISSGTLLALVAFSLIGVAAGHALGGPDPDDRTVLALATAARHPGVALALATATFPEEKTVALIVLWHLVVASIVSGPYARWRGRVHAAEVS